jgi:prepilin-type N-terminal cleavage/methylation domain-containing protein
MKSRTKGFSLIELMIVVAIIVILSVLAIPSIQRINQIYKLDSSGHTVAGLLGQARLQAVHNNGPAYAHFDIANPTLAFINNDNTGTLAAGDPDVGLAGGVAFQAPGALDHQQLDAYLGKTAGAPGGPSIQIGTAIGFNARGLPCLENGTPAVCQQDDGTGAVPAFEWFMADGNGNFEAVTVTAAGRIKSWRNTGPGTWQ